MSNNGSGTILFTGTNLAFTTDTIVGSIAKPETGNFTVNLLDALPGKVAVVIHNNGSAPTFDAKYFKILSISGAYVTGQINYIFCMFINPTEVVYCISQRS